MNKEGVIFIITTLVLYLLQVAICDHILLFQCATPVIFIYCLVKIPIDFSQNWVYTFAFLLGLGVDIWADTPGVNSLSCTIMAALRKPIYYAYVSRDDKTSKLTPTLASIGIWDYAKFLGTFTLLYCLLMFGLEYFSFADAREILEKAGASSVLSFLLMLAIDSLTSEKK